MNFLRQIRARRSAVPIILIAMAAAALGTVPASAGPPANFVLFDPPRPLDEVRFDDSEGRVRTLSEFRGRTILLNLWATWCGPCRREMPMLDDLQAELGGPEFKVVALSIDRAGLEPVRKFYAELGVRNLALYIDSSGKVLRTLKAYGLPTTLLIGPEGRELGRLVGPAEWNAPEMVEFLRDRIKPASPGG